MTLQLTDIPTVKEVTVEEVLDAMEKNGYRQAYGRYFEYSDHDVDKPVIAACAMGQAAINLGVRAESLDNFLSKFIVDSWSMNSYIVEQNDVHHLSPKAIAGLIRTWLAKEGFTTILDEIEKLEEKEYKTA